MNMYENMEREKSDWVPITEIVFYEPRTFPSQWNLSEFLPPLDNQQMSTNEPFGFED
jgi:hypothetical protein